MSSSRENRMETFCPLPWVHLSTEANTKVRPCCIHQKEIRKNDGLAYHATDESLDEIFQSQYMKSVRQAFREGQKLSACHMCWNDEANGKESKRQLNIRSMELTSEDLAALIETEPESPTYLQIIITNQCNLKCRTCNPVASTKWVAESEQRGLIKYEHKHNREIYSENSKFKITQRDWFKNLEYLELMGGEPFLHKDLEKMLNDLIDLGYSKRIKVFISTNGTIYPEALIKKCRGQFRFIGINLSIDGIGDQYNYMRHGADWNKVQENILKFYQNSLSPEGNRCFDHTVGSQLTVSWMNILAAPAVFNFYLKNCPKLLRAFNIVYYPDEFNPIHLPKAVKNHIRKEFEKHITSEIWPDLQMILNHIESGDGDSFSFKAGLVAVMDGDRFRKESYPQVFPDMFQLIASDWHFVEANYESIKQEAFSKEYLMIDHQIKRTSPNMESNLNQNLV